MVASSIGGIVSSVIWSSTAVLGLATLVPGVVGVFGAEMLLKRKWKPVAIETGPIFGLSAQMLPAIFIPYTFVDASVRVLVGVVCALMLIPVLVGLEKRGLLRRNRPESHGG